MDEDSRKCGMEGERHMGLRERDKKIAKAKSRKRCMQQVSSMEGKTLIETRRTQQSGTYDTKTTFL